MKLGRARAHRSTTSSSSATAQLGGRNGTTFLAKDVARSTGLVKWSVPAAASSTEVHFPPRSIGRWFLTPCSGPVPAGSRNPRSSDRLWGDEPIRPAPCPRSSTDSALSRFGPMSRSSRTAPARSPWRRLNRGRGGKLAEGLRQIGARARRPKVGFYADNSRRWILTDLAYPAGRRCLRPPRHGHPAQGDGRDLPSTPASDLVFVHGKRARPRRVEDLRDGDVPEPGRDRSAWIRRTRRVAPLDDLLALE